MVRKKGISIPDGSIKSAHDFVGFEDFVQFQFQMVRLKEVIFTSDKSATEAISIPDGSIKRDGINFIPGLTIGFQFQMVRLKEPKGCFFHPLSSISIPDGSIKRFQLSIAP